MFNKSLLALALSAAAFGASASTIEVGTFVNGTTTFTSIKDADNKATAAKVSKEGLALAKNLVKFQTGADTVAGQNVSLKLKLGTDYPSSSVFVIEVANAQFDTGTTGVASPTMVKLDNAHTDLTLLDASNVTKLVFNVGGTSTKDDEYLLNAALKNVTGDVTFTVYANAPVISGFDKSEFKALTITQQHAVKTDGVTKTNAKIDVGADRKAFTTDNTGVEDFSVVLERKTVNVHTVEGYDDATNKNSQLLTLEGDFSSFDLDKDGKLDDEKLTFAGNGGVLALDKAGVITVAEQSNTTLDAIGVNVNVGAGNTAVISPTTFKGTVVSKYQLASDSAQKASYSTDVEFGAWSLNGSVVEIPYMPFGANTVPTIYLTNTSTKSGDVSVRYILEGSTDGWKAIAGSLGTVKPGVTDLTSSEATGINIIKAIMADAGTDVTKGRVAIEVTTNVPGKDVKVTALFKVVSEQDRAVMATIRKDS